MNNEKILDRSFIKEWKGEQLRNLSLMYPEIPTSDLEALLDEQILERCVDAKASLHNNYENRYFETSLLHVIDWIKESNPIMAGFGVFFKNQHLADNPSAKMLDKFLIQRKKYKGQLKKYNPGDREYTKFDNYQKSEKICANSWYGGSGCKTFKNFNLYTASATTQTGQQLISTARAIAETFLANNNKFYDIDQCFEWLDTVLSESDHKFNYSQYLRPVSVDELFVRIKENFREYDNSWDFMILRFLKSLPEEMIQRMYFKNNFREFAQLPEVRKILLSIMTTVNTTEGIENPKESFRVNPKAKGDAWEFVNPNDIPLNIHDDLILFKDLCMEFVYVDLIPIERIDRLKHDSRMVVSTIDTDSIMIIMTSWLETCKLIMQDKPELFEKDEELMIYAQVNICAYVMTNVISQNMYRYTSNSNIPEEIKGRINMKNEFLFLKQILASTKKRYISLQKLREGEVLVPPVEDIKGFDFMKSTTSVETCEKFMHIIRSNVLDMDEINVAGCVQGIRNLEKEVIDSLRGGDKTYLTPASVSEVEAYADPYSQQGIMGVIAWNTAYPEKSIQLPEKLDIVKVNLKTIEDLELVKQYDEDVYNRLKTGIFESSIDKLRKKGVYIVAVPRNEKVPDWVKAAIDVTTISSDVISKFYPVLESLSFEIFGKKSAGNRSYYSNIVDF